MREFLTWAFLKRAVLLQQSEHHEHSDTPYSTLQRGAASKRQTDYLTQTLRCFLKNLFLLFHHPSLLPLSHSFFFRIITIVPFMLPVDWGLLSRPTNQAVLRHLCRPPSQWQVSLKGRRLNNAGGTPRRLSSSLSSPPNPFSFHVGPNDFF